MVSGPDDALVVYDFMNRKFMQFASSGKLLRSFRFSQYTLVKNICPGTDGRLYFETQKIFYRSARPTIFSVFRLDPEFKERSVIDSVEIDGGKLIENPQIMKIPVPFGPVYAWDILPDGNIVIGNSGEETIKIVTPEREFLKEFPHNLKKRKVTGAEKEAFF